ncbi:poly-beta-1,6-N-acetyl-D-glucosamine biosynthesis protein PgaD [Pseudomonas prosekii]|uniref:Biofilm PGA synthesis protein PgaD n=1 Tax=Pseudomonas prosekii TaxID=1148509 RepID=A0A1H1VM57_9PSED|nr:poly-beta-1,6-N-acetyl-D-glucosamine biosynthesis protein PgaD [Pseudomonas prosekii]PKH29665.1 poly-beta-1,6-N-acetyl-D-glucosamine biosynthesis protein PgaD [Pseudomonas sp. 43NM1]PWE45240.1 poly-beta-1,6-N-acetyl-D-glucosamine biosynthesis protein PgaD [Pseudomonas prosekii]SDS85967.1 biofilm PGA synthesis protein PgaD [Pseudomonas prosekii]
MKIIRTRQRPILLVIDALFTVLAWVGLLYMLIRGLWPLIDTRGGALIEPSAFDALGTLQIYLWVAVVNALILVTWARYQHRKSRSYAQRRLAAPVVDDHGLSKSFKITGDGLAQLRAPGSMTIHNNQDGDVSHVVPHYLPLNAPLQRPLVIRLPAEDDVSGRR